MGLFSRKKKVEPTYARIEFNHQELCKQITKIASTFFDYKGMDAHESVFKFLDLSLNLAILESATMKEPTVESMAYQRGKIDAIKNILLAREKAISDERQAKAAKASKSGHKSKRSYLDNRPRIVGGMSD